MATVARRLSQVPTPIAGDSVQKAKEGELHTSRHNVHVEFEKFYGTEPRRVDRRFDLSLLHLTYLPKVERIAFSSLISVVKYGPQRLTTSNLIG